MRNPKGQQMPTSLEFNQFLQMPDLDFLKANVTSNTISSNWIQKGDKKLS